MKVFESVAPWWRGRPGNTARIEDIPPIALGFWRERFPGSEPQDGPELRSHIDQRRDDIRDLEFDDFESRAFYALRAAEPRGVQMMAGQAIWNAANALIHLDLLTDALRACQPGLAIRLADTRPRLRAVHDAATDIAATTAPLCASLPRTRADLGWAWRPFTDSGDLRTHWTAREARTRVGLVRTWTSIAPVQALVAAMIEDVDRTGFYLALIVNPLRHWGLHEQAGRADQIRLPLADLREELTDLGVSVDY